MQVCQFFTHIDRVAFWYDALELAFINLMEISAMTRSEQYNLLWICGYQIFFDQGAVYLIVSGDLPIWDAHYCLYLNLFHSPKMENYNTNGCLKQLVQWLHQGTTTSCLAKHCSSSSRRTLRPRSATAATMEPKRFSESSPLNWLVVTQKLIEWHCICCRVRLCWWSKNDCWWSMLQLCSHFSRQGPWMDLEIVDKNCTEANILAFY